MSDSWVECYFSHYHNLFRNPIERRAFRQDSISQPIEILVYDDVFEGCRVFCSLGLTHYSSIIGTISEVLVAVDAGWNDIPFLLAHSLFYIIQQPIHFGPGVVIGGFEFVRPHFAEFFGKTAFYFTTAHTLSTLPEAFSYVSCRGKEGTLQVGYLISAKEYGFWLKQHSRRFEELLGQKQVDLLNLSRPSAI